MQDVDKICVLTIYFDHFGRHDIQARKQCVNTIMNYLKCSYIIDFDMSIHQFNQWLFDEFNYHLASEFQLTIRKITDMIIDKIRTKTT